MGKQKVTVEDNVMKFRCIKGMAESDNVNLLVTKNDIVKYLENGEGYILVEGLSGWCKGWELSFSPKQFAEHFESVEETEMEENLA